MNRTFECTCSRVVVRMRVRQLWSCKNVMLYLLLLKSVNVIQLLEHYTMGLIFYCSKSNKYTKIGIFNLTRDHSV